MADSSNTGGMGSTKHGKSGRSGKSPKLRHALRRDAERTEIKDRSKLNEPKSSVRELFDGRLVH